jgi:amino acid transporter
MLLGNRILFLVVLNSIVGGGLFVNLATFNNNLGSWGPLMYLLGYLLFFPIIFCIGSLAQRQQVEGGLFLLAQKQLGETLGFVACWSYFLGRAVSVALLLQFLTLGLKHNFAILQPLSDFFVATLLISGMVCLNIFGLSNTGVTQKVFTLLKLLPIVILSGAALCMFSPKAFDFGADWGLFQTHFNVYLPSAVYALQGFTIVIHMGHLIKKPERLLYILLAATATAGIMCATFQAVVFSSIGKILAGDALAVFVKGLGVRSSFFGFFLSNLLNMAIGSSCFMVLTGNCWNLFALAKNDFLPGKKFFIAKLNASPPLCLGLHALLSLGFLCICKNIVALQAASVFATFCTYSLCSIAACRNFFSENKYLLFIGFAALLSCGYIIWSSIKSMLVAGLSYEFLLLYLCGVGLVFRKKGFTYPV